MAAEKLGRHATTVYVTSDMRAEIARRGMTVSGAFLAGWEAIQDRIKYAARIEQLETELAETMRNIRGYQRMVQDMMDQSKQVK